MSADETPFSIDIPKQPSWTSLPANALVRVFLKLPVRDLCCCIMVCHRFCDAAQTDSIWDALLQQQYGRSAAIHATTTSKECMRQLRTSSLWTCGSHWSSVGSPGPSSTTTLLKLWSNIPSSTSLPLDAYCAEPSRGFVVTAVAAGRHHLLLLSCDGQVIDTRAPAPVTPPPPLTDCNQVPTADQQQAAAAAAALVDATNNHWEHVLAADAMAELLEQQQQQGGELDQDDQHHHGQPEQQQVGVLQLKNPWRPPDARIATVAAGPGHVLAVSSCGGVWGWGSNECGQLGLGHNNTWQGTPVNIDQVLEGAWKADGDVIVSAACGDSHSALLAAGGAVYTAGCNKQGQCAQGIMLQMCPVFCQVLGHDVAAAAVACGVANTVVATSRGRLLVCGDSSCGQCGPSHIKQGCCHIFIDMGPEVTWHGLSRPTSTHVAAAGGNVLDALPKVTQVAAGCGTGYAVTEEGELYAWGAGSKGQLGRGGCTKVQATPAKLPWARHITHISASLDGAFAAAVDNNGVLHTWGAGKWGQLGHGDTSKRTVGRAVKQLKHQTVLQAICGRESLLVLTCDRPYISNATSKLRQSSTDKSATTSAVGSGGGASNLRTSSGVSLEKNSSMTSSASSSNSRRRRSGSNLSTAAAGGVDADGSSSCNLSSMEGVDWVDVEAHGPFYCPRPRSGSAQKGSLAARQGAAAAAAATNSAKVDLESSSAVAPAPAATSNPLASSRDRASSSSSINRTHSTISSNSSSSDCKPSDTSRVAKHRLPAAASRVRPNAQGSTAASPGAAAEVDEQEFERSHDPSEAGLIGKRHALMDKGFRRLLKRVLKQFVSDNKQRELEFPASLSSADRYHIHVAADAWGLGHASHHDENGDRLIKVWKVSRSRRMVSGADAGFESE